MTSLYESQLELEEAVTRKEIAIDRTPVSVDNDSQAIYVDGMPTSIKAISRLSQMIGIPANFIQACTPHLGMRVIQEFYGRQERPITSLILADQIVSFHYSDWIPVRTSAVLFALQEALPDENMTISKQVAGIGSHDVFITSANAFEVADGKEIFFGVRMSGSMDASSGHQVRLSYYRPFCKNGASITEHSYTLGRRSLDSEEMAIEAIVDNATGLFAQRRQYSEKIALAASRKVEDPYVEINHLSARYGLSPRILESVMAAYDEEPTDTTWGVMQAFTRAANNTTLASSHQNHLWNLGGDHLSMQDDPCPVCGTHHVHSEN